MWKNLTLFLVSTVAPFVSSACNTLRWSFCADKWRGVLCTYQAVEGTRIGMGAGETAWKQNGHGSVTNEREAVNLVPCVHHCTMLE